MYCKPPDEVVKPATEFFQGIRTFGDYNFAFNNCQDFASFCKTGIKSSEQRNKVDKTLLVGTKKVTKVSATVAVIGIAGIAAASALHSIVKRTLEKVDGRNGKPSPSPPG
ncbi:hypothetical protein Patl1_23227 [Pistacia atlantica]|uniref:Uncharacterized protein n=1 Tax=Pistacia atlantica TaxID=434234 RepID=A0ACC0ZY46_9ROSI|nr:hypothetical protein Patl1_23227 [Pistacia atlantica]